MKELKVKGIEEGTVIDHIPSGRAIQVMKILGGNGETTMAAMNVSSTKLGKKDIIKIEGKFLSPAETNKLALIAPTATINIIRGSSVVEKRKVDLPDSLQGLVACPNPNCISNDHEEFVKSRLDHDGKVYRCYYCERAFDPKDLLP